MSLFLTPAELRELTDLEQPAAQVRWLKDRQWQYEIGASGRPKVARAYFERRMAGEPPVPEEQAKKRSGVDLSALDALAGRH